MSRTFSIESEVDPKMVDFIIKLRETITNTVESENYTDQEILAGLASVLLEACWLAKMSSAEIHAMLSDLAAGVPEYIALRNEEILN